MQNNIRLLYEIQAITKRYKFGSRLVRRKNNIIYLNVPCPGQNKPHQAIINKNRPDQTRQDQTRPDKTRQDQTRTDKNRQDQTGPD